VGIITARLLSREDFGYIAALALFTVLSNTLIESGFTSALVRRKNNTDADYTTALYFNVLISIVLYAILFISAPYIEIYFEDMPGLSSLARVLFLAIIINAFGIIQTIILTKTLQFQKLAFAELSGAILSAIITIVMAIKGFGYWAIAAQQISQPLFRTIILWITSNWRPCVKINPAVIKELLNFSSILILTSIISNCMRYIYNFIIGKRYAPEELGSYGQAYKFHQIPHSVITTTLSGVAYPVLSSLNSEPVRQKNYLRKLIRICSFLTFPVMVGLYAIAPNMITVVLTDKWQPMLPYFRILLIAAIFIPFINIILNCIIAIGRPKVNFYLEMTRNLLMLIMLFIFNSSIEKMLIGYLIATFIAYVIDIITLSRLIGYSLTEHIKDIVPYCLISLIMSVVVIYMPDYINVNVYVMFTLQIVIGVILYLGVSLISGSQILRDIRELIFKKKHNIQTHGKD
jgi:O-antigen/teichoic acid export membrane protein